ncbi:hypothetical protein UCMB321_5196 [Pseudomonas batumici]|uniref:Uncharacterized protein n=1 Tax=Pseudomonas batumici TaxID=226910 RepID=A0A0C2EQK7_9PSED|nr:hypothetical protein UCMB321_5196 [Pseudomonas batumici]
MIGHGGGSLGEWPLRGSRASSAPTVLRRANHLRTMPIL